MGVVVAPATGWGHAALALVRATGPDALRQLDPVLEPMYPGPWAPRVPRRVRFRDENGVFDDGLACWWPGPNSYTGEDLVELSVHGNPRIVERLLSACVVSGARMAEAGEFTRRAVLAGRIDLLEAEAVDLACRATSDQGLAIARSAFEGRLGGFVGEVRQRLVEVAAELEARLDWPADELATVEDPVVTSEMKQLAELCEGLAATATVGRRYVEGATVALVGPTNAGKSSLFNALLGEERALVHDVAGTTRDVIESTTQCGPIQVKLFDTAGERETDNPVEKAGIEHARKRAEESDLLLLVLPADQMTDLSILDHIQRPRTRPHLVVFNRIDCPGAVRPPEGAIATCAITGQGVEALRDAIKASLVGSTPRSEALQIASVRQQEILLQTGSLCREAHAALAPGGPAVSSDYVHEAIEAIDRLTGRLGREDVLSALFSRFCIGK